MTYKHIVFDIDGTLLDTEYALMHSLQQTVLQFSGRLVELDDLHTTFGRTADDSVRSLGIADVGPAVRVWKAKYLEEPSRGRFFPGVKAALKELRARGLILGLLSSKTRREYETDFLEYGLADQFTHVILADDSPRHKPDPAPMLAYLRRSGAGPREVLYVGDTLYDMQCAQGANVDGALAMWGRKLPADGIPATWYLAGPEDVLKTLGGREA